jgi:glycosyltransferase involved in cell wall biosynthesis
MIPANTAIARATSLLRACVASRESQRERSVMQLLPSVGWGGAERLACTMHRQAQARGWRSTFDAPRLKALETGLWEDGGRDRGGALGEAVDGDRARSEVLRAWAMEARARVERERPAIVHAHLAYPDRFGAALVASAGRPLVCSFQLLPEPGRWWSPDEVFAWRSDTLLERVGRFLSRVTFVGPSEDDVRRLRALVGPRATVERVVNCPPLPRVNEPEATAFAWREGAVRLLSVGRLVPQKGFDRMIDALADARLARASWQWVIVGAGPEERALRERIEQRGLSERVVIETDRRGSQMYPSADVVLCPSRSEGFPLVPMEAVEAGVCVKVSRIAAHEELFAKEPAAVLPEDGPGWAEAIEALVTSPSARDALRARERAALPEDFRAETSQGYERVYERAWRGQE